MSIPKPLLDGKNTDPDYLVGYKCRFKKDQKCYFKKNTNSKKCERFLGRKIRTFNVGNKADEMV
ncbi:MAG: hypothetical protein V3V00_08490 [Saprospiraceae bacterium]